MLSIFDLILVVSSLVSFGVIGFYFRSKSGANSVDYFLARRQMSVIPAAFSISVSFFSSSALTIYQGEVAIFGCPMYTPIFSALVSGIVAVFFVLHRLYYSPHLSVFLFLEDRFSRQVRVVNSLIFVFSGLMTIAVTGYTVAISAEVLAGIPFWLSAIIAGLLSTVYSTLGGIRAVIWTDVCQAVLMVLFLVLTCIRGLISVGSFEEFVSLVDKSGRAQMRYSESPTNRYNVQSLCSFFVIHFLYMQCVSQPGVQRWRSVKSLADAKLTVVVSLLFNVFFSCLVFAAGLVLYAFYARCNAVTLEEHFPNSDRLSLYFVQKELSSWPGTQGLCLVGLLSGALSTMSSFLNSLAAVTLEDCVKIRFPNLNEKLELNASKALTAIFGVVSTALIFLASQSRAVTIVHVTAMSISMAPPLGIFFLGMWTKRANALGVSLGMGVGVILVAWLSIGSALYGNRHQPLPSPQCPGNTTTLIQIVAEQIRARIPEEDFLIEKGFFDHVYGTSFYWYSAMSFLASCIFGYLFSVIIAYFRKDRDLKENVTEMCDDLNKHPEIDISSSLIRSSSNCEAEKTEYKSDAVL